MCGLKRRQQGAGRRPRGSPRQSRKPTPPPRLPCGDRRSFAVLMDRQGFSPGEISGTATPNFLRALSAFRSARNIAATGGPDCETWRALGGDTAAPAVTSYVVTD